MLSMLCGVVVFGVHSFVDWTWYVPGDAFVALVCAGWLAGRGPRTPTGAPPTRERPGCAHVREWSAAAAAPVHGIEAGAEQNRAPSAHAPAGFPRERRRAGEAAGARALGRGPRPVHGVRSVRCGSAWPRPW